MGLLFRDRNNYFQSVVNGEIPGQSAVFVNGYNLDIDTAAEEDIWFNPAGTANFVPPTVARTHAIISSNIVADIAAGTGARRVLIEGINGAGVETSETVVLAAVATNTVNQYIFINKMTVTDVGTLHGSNAGNITATALIDATVSCAIEAGASISSNAFYMVPVGKKAFIHAILPSMQNTNTGSSCDIKMLIRPSAAISQKPYQQLFRQTIQATGANAINILPINPIAIEALSFFKFRASATANNSVVSLSAHLILQTL